MGTMGPNRMQFRIVQGATMATLLSGALEDYRYADGSRFFSADNVR